MSKPHILVINPNTSPEVSASVQRLAADEAGDDATIEVVTAPFGARYISSRASFSIAGHAVLDAYANALATSRQPDATIVGCFGDPGIEGLREIAKAPVLGFAESGMLAAAAQPGNFVIATVGAAWRPIIEDLARRHGLAERLAGMAFIDRWTSDPATAAIEIEKSARALGAAQIIIGGTGLIPLMSRMPRNIALPVIDPHRHAVREAIRQARAHNPVARSAALPPAQFLGISPALASILGPSAAA
ncbi:MAG: aspartate/glutamate racemase family protein [Candidatus Kaistia colombiensis]|nr:MAG: aspartate/glutamate racemase family protein [Kaistia sp.]